MQSHKTVIVSATLRSAVRLTMLLCLASAAAAQTQPESTRFLIERFAVSGSTLLPAAEIERMLAPYTGQSKDFTDVQRALETLKNAYNRMGYGVVQVLLPEQDITQGVIQFRVIEARIGQVKIEGNKHFDEQNIRSSLPTLRAGSIPRSTEIARNLQLLADNPAKQNSILFKSGASEGEVNAEVKVTDERPWKTFVTLDNTGTRETGHTRAGVGFRHSNLFNRDHEVNLRYVTSVEHPSDVRVYGAGYYIPVYPWAGAFTLVAGYSDVNSGSLPGILSVSGKGTVFGARYTQHLTPASPYEHKVSVGVDYRAYQNQIVSTSGVSLVPDITVHPLSVSYSGTWRRATTLLGFQTSLVRNIPGGSHGRDADFEASRPGAQADYWIFRYGVNLSHAFEGNWIANLSVNGQATRDRLIPGEQFGLGGPDSVRGLRPREVANDRGYQGSVELQTPDLTRGLGGGNHSTRLAAFFDWGSVSPNQPERTARESVSSAGIGLRYLWRRDLWIKVDFGHLLDGTSSRESGRTRLHFAVAASF